MNQLCAMLNVPKVSAAPQDPQLAVSVGDDSDEDDPVLSRPSGRCLRVCDNLALGALDFTHVASQMIAPTMKQTPRVGDLCVRLTPLTPRMEDYASIVDLYNTYCVKGNAQMAARCINSYVRSSCELYIPAIPIHTFVSEWNRTLKQFHDMIRCNQEWTTANGQPPAEVRASLAANVTALALGNVPVLSEHLWYVLHCIVTKPSLVKEVVQLVGAVSSCSGALYRTGDVNNLTVPCKDMSSSSRLYLIAKSTESATGNDATPLGKDAGAALGLVWVSNEEELFDHFRNVARSFYVHLGTESGNTFRCNGFCEWRGYDPVVVDRMISIGRHVTQRHGELSNLAGDTGDSARAIHRQ